MTTTNTTHANSSGLPKADVLIVTVTQVEVDAVLEVFRQETGHTFQRHRGTTNVYFELGRIQGANVFMVQSDMGTSGPSSALLTIDRAISELSPSSVVMVGIAFGFDDTAFSIGDILVSQQLLSYEAQKVATNNEQERVIPRGARPHASPKLLNMFRSSVPDWHESARVAFGLILSGEKLVDNRAFRDELLSFAPEALGGEMEGSGLYAAAYPRKTDWILVKAICDWADGNKAEGKVQRQKLAAENAARFTLHVLRQGGFAQDSQHTTPVSPATSQPTYSLGTLIRPPYDIHASWVIAVAWEPNGTHIASGAADGTVRVWDATTGTTYVTYRGHAGPLAAINIQRTIYTLAWSPDGMRIASGGDGSNVFVWNAATGQTLTVYKGHKVVWSNIFALAWSPDGLRIASACSGMSIVDKTIHIWDVATERLVKKCSARDGFFPHFSILSLAWSPDGKRIAATVFDDKAIRIWSVATGRQIASLPSPAGHASHIVWSHDGTRLALAHSNGTAQVWNVQAGENIVHYRGHTSDVRAIAWSPDDRRLATASNDTTVQLWDAANGNHIYTYRGHRDWATSVSWSPDGTRIASGSNDKTVQIWQAI